MGFEVQGRGKRGRIFLSQRLKRLPLHTVLPMEILPSHIVLCM